MIKRIIDILLPGTNDHDHCDLRKEYKEKIESGEIDEQEIEVSLTKQSTTGFEIMSPPGMEEMTEQIQGLFQSLNSSKTEKKKITIKEAKIALVEDECSKSLDEETLKAVAVSYTHLTLPTILLV